MVGLISPVKKSGQNSKESWPEGPGVDLPLKGAVF